MENAGWDQRPIRSVPLYRLPGRRNAIKRERGSRGHRSDDPGCSGHRETGRDDRRRSSQRIVLFQDIEFDLLYFLVIHFVQLGDVVLGLPALMAIRERFPDARITTMLGKPGADII